MENPIKMGWFGGPTLFLETPIYILGGVVVTQIFVIFTPNLMEMIQFDEHIVEMGWSHQLYITFFTKGFSILLVRSSTSTHSHQNKMEDKYPGNLQQDPRFTDPEKKP